MCGPGQDKTPCLTKWANPISGDGLPLLALIGTRIAFSLCLATPFRVVRTGPRETLRFVPPRSRCCAIQFRTCIASYSAGGFASGGGACHAASSLARRGVIPKQPSGRSTPVKLGSRQLEACIPIGGIAGSATERPVSRWRRWRPPIGADSSRDRRARRRGERLRCARRADAVPSRNAPMRFGRP